MPWHLEGDSIEQLADLIHHKILKDLKCLGTWKVMAKILHWGGFKMVKEPKQDYKI